MRMALIMDLPTRLRLLARKLPGDDARHALLDVYADFLEITARPESFPPSLQDEVRELRSECARIRPRFPSHSQTSILFDREGVRQKGLRQAQSLARRIIALSAALDATNGDEDEQVS
ncbi:MAG: hypothetical protein ACREJB_12460 [Planctomycetaceae bacterium]